MRRFYLEVTTLSTTEEIGVRESGDSFRYIAPQDTAELQPRESGFDEVSHRDTIEGLAAG